MPRKQREVRMWPVRWRGRITRDVGTEFIFAESAKEARELFRGQYPTREVVGVGKPPAMKPLK